MSAQKVVYPGSFDPFTVGHLDVVERGLKLFGSVVILVAGSASKSCLFDPEKRVELIEQSTSHLEGVEVVAWSGLTTDYMKENGLATIIRGMRATSDFDHEFTMAAMNRDLLKGLETVVMMSSRELFFISSTMVKEVWKFGGSIDHYVPDPVAQALEEKRNS